MPTAKQPSRPFPVGRGLALIAVALVLYLVLGWLVVAANRNATKERLAIIGVSAEGGGQTVRFLKVGANDFLVKPVEVEEFTCRVHMQLDMLDLLENLRELRAAHQG